MHHYEHFWLDPKFWVAVSFVLFFALLGKKLWGAIAGALSGGVVAAAIALIKARFEGF